MNYDSKTILKQKISCPHPQPPTCPTPDAEKLSKAFCKITSMHNIRNIYLRIYVPDKAHPKIIKSSENIRNKT